MIQEPATNALKGKRGLQRIINAAGYSKDGLIAAYRHEAVDDISLEIRPLAKRAKDVGSAAQMLALTLLAILWAMALCL